MSEDLIVRIEQEAIKVIDEKRESLAPKVPIDELARRVFPDLPLQNARMVIQRMRKPQSNGKTRSVSLGEFVKMAKALGMSPLDALGIVLNRIEETKP